MHSEICILPYVAMHALQLQRAHAHAPDSTLALQLCKTTYYVLPLVTVTWKLKRIGWQCANAK